MSKLRIIILICAVFAMAFSLCACTDGNGTETSAQLTTDAPVPDTTDVPDGTDAVTTEPVTAEVTAEVTADTTTEATEAVTTDGDTSAEETTGDGSFDLPMVPV